MMNDYLNKVLIYLRQELPDNYKNNIELSNQTLIVSLPVGIKFNEEFDEIHNAIIKSTTRVRNREIDLKFTVKTEFQQRDFIILK
jgi:hypothetical protein